MPKVRQDRPGAASIPARSAARVPAWTSAPPAETPAAPGDFEARRRRVERLGHRFGRSAVAPDSAPPAVPAVETPSAAQPAADASRPLPVQAMPNWKDVLAGAGGVAGAAMLGAGLLTGGTTLAAAGGVGLLASGIYGGYRALQARRERSYQRRQQQPMPNDMHFVWLGGKVPPERQQNMVEWGRRADRVQPNLWLDESSAEASADDLDALRHRGVRIRRVSELEERGGRFERARRLLPTVDERGVNPAAAGALSDIARLEILHRHGGHYMDSDNAPGENAARFADMTGPMGFRLGWGSHNRQLTFSNDAMSANPGNRYIGRYLDAVHRNLTPQAAGDIRSRERARVERGVMTTTGPEAMKHVPFPVTPERSERVLREAEGVTDLGSAPRLPGIALFANNLAAGGGRFSDHVGRLHADVAYDETRFQRGFGSSWRS
jgi:hypothetical protein